LQRDYTDSIGHSLSPTYQLVSIQNYDEDYRLKAAALSRKDQQVFTAAIFAFHTGKAVAQITAVSISINDLLQIGPQETVLPGVMIVIDPNTLHVPPVNSSSTSYRKVIGHLQKYALGTYFRRTLYGGGIAVLQHLYGG
jgi:hypothetical protein